VPNAQRLTPRRRRHSGEPDRGQGLVDVAEPALAVGVEAADLQAVEDVQEGAVEILRVHLQAPQAAIGEMVDARLVRLGPNSIAGELAATPRAGEAA